MSPLVALTVLPGDFNQSNERFMYCAVRVPSVPMGAPPAGRGALWPIHALVIIISSLLQTAVRRKPWNGSSAEEARHA